MAIMLALSASPALAADSAPAGSGVTETVETEPGAVAADPATELVLARQALEELRVVVDDLTARNDQLVADNDQLVADNDQLVADNDSLVADNDSLRTAVDDITVERDRMAKSLSHFDELYDPLEADRQLLFELRKGLPETRPEAEAQIARMRSLALASNPSRLGQLVDRVDDAAPAFLDWRFTEFGTAEEASQAYIDSGAVAFETNMDEFRNEVLMSVANRLDGLLTILDRIR
jgi:hypothetical protein